jgi:hypothetical protein
MKSVAFSADGQQLAVAAIPNHYVTLPDDSVEQDLLRTWADAAATLRELSDKITDLASRLIAISVTAQGDGMWLVDKEGEPVGPATIWLDSRAASIVEDYVKTEDYADHYARTGTGLTVVQMSGKLAWTQRHRPAMLSRATHAFHCKDWIYFKLTGQRCTDPSEANFTFGNYKTREYQLDILAASERSLKCWGILAPRCCNMKLHLPPYKWPKRWMPKRFFYEPRVSCPMQRFARWPWLMCMCRQRCGYSIPLTLPLWVSARLIFMVPLKKAIIFLAPISWLTCGQPVLLGNCTNILLMRKVRPSKPISINLLSALRSSSFGMRVAELLLRAGKINTRRFLQHLLANRSMCSSQM